MSFVLSLKTESLTFLAVSITFLQSNRGRTFSKLQSSLKFFSFLGSGAEASRGATLIHGTRKPESGNLNRGLRMMTEKFTLAMSNE